MLSNNILAAIDIGTNSFHLVVAEIIDKNTFKVLTKDKEVVRLGSSSKDMKYLSLEAMERGVEALKRFKLVCDSYQANVRAIATSATREANNKEEFITRVYKETGIHIEIVSGYEEARLIYLGVLQALDVYNKRILLIDIGGGSTEFLVGRSGGVEFAHSLKIGAVRLMHKYFEDGKIKNSAAEDARDFIKGAIYPAVRAIKNEKVDLVVGTSGTISTLALMSYLEETEFPSIDFNINNYTFSKKSLFKIISKILKAGTAEERIKLAGLDPKRADIIVAGSLILEEIFTDLGIEEMTVSNFALREGIILDSIQKLRGTEHLGHLSDVRYKSVLNLARMTNNEQEHADQVTRLANKIFEFLKDKHSLSEEEHEYLEAACILHDIGYYIAHSSHHKHSYYLIRNSELLGFTDYEIEIIANIARYHRKSQPKLKHEAFAKLDTKGQETVRKLAGILRVADGLDRGHNSVVEDIDMVLRNNEMEIIVKTSPNANAELEIWGAKERKDLFENVFGYKIEFIVSPVSSASLPYS